MKYLSPSSVVLSLTVLVSFAAPAPVLAFFDDGADASGATYAAGTLAFTVVPGALASGIGTTFSPTLGFSLNNTGSIAPQYEAKMQSHSCAAAFYNNLNIVVSGPVSYSGPLASMDATTTSATGAWSMTVSAGSHLSAAPGETCVIDLDIDAWQNGFTSAASGGFAHHESVVITLTAAEAIGQQHTSSVVLNEIYADPNGTTPPLDREWVELYNGTDSPVDISGWAVSEIQGSTEYKHVIGTSCPSGSSVGHAIPYGTSNTVIQPGGLLVIEFCASSRLNNAGDTVRLYDASNTLLDSYTYSSYTYSGNKAAGNSYARIPDGYLWVDPKPTPGEPNVATMADLLAAGLTDDQIADVVARMDEQQQANTGPSAAQADAGEEDTPPPVSSEEQTTTDDSANAAGADAGVDVGNSAPAQDDADTPPSDDARPDADTKDVAPPPVKQEEPVQSVDDASVAEQSQQGGGSDHPQQEDAASETPQGEISAPTPAPAAEDSTQKSPAPESEQDPPEATE